MEFYASDFRNRIAISVVFKVMRIAIPFIFLFAASASPVPQKHLNLENAVALSGYDAVSYHQGAPKVGQDEWSYQYGGAAYRFASKENLETLIADPDRYAPAYGGWCAYAMLDGEKVEVDPLSFKLINGKTYLFYDGFGGDTLKRWNRKLQKASESSLVRQADDHWANILSQ